MLSSQNVLPIIGICLFAIGTALPVESREDAGENLNTGDATGELPGAWPNAGGDVRNAANVRQAEKLAAEMNQHLTAFEGDEDADEADMDGDAFAAEDEVEDDEQFEDELMRDNAEDPESDVDDDSNEDRAGEIDSTSLFAAESEEDEEDGEEEDDVQHAAHKDADADRFASDAVSALSHDSDEDLSALEGHEEEIQDEIDEADAFDEDSDNDMDMMADFDQGLTEQASVDVPDEENVRNNDEMVGMPFSPKVE